HIRVPLDPLPGPVRPLEFPSLEAALAWCEHERPALAAATRLAAESGLHEAAWKLPAAAMSFFYRGSHWADWVTTHQPGQAGDGLGEAWMLNNLGMVYGVQHMAESVTCFEQALALSREIGDTGGETRAADNVAKAYFRLGRVDEALAAAGGSLIVQRPAGSRYREGLALELLRPGRHAEAVGHQQEALMIFRELGDPWTQADSLSDLGETYLSLKQVDQAIGRLTESLAIRRDISDRFGQADALRRLGHAHRQAGDEARARELLSEAITLFEEVGDAAEAARTRASLAETITDAG